MLKKIKNTLVFKFLKYPFSKIIGAIPSDRLFITIKYISLMGKYPSLKNPKLFTEKIQWLKLNDRTPLHTICADKYRVREYVKEKIGEEYLIPLILETKDVRDINVNNLPDYPVIVKTNHNFNSSFVIKNKNDFNFDEIQKKLKNKLNQNHFQIGREWAYKNIAPRIIVEKLMTDKNQNDLLTDYKIYCFNGTPTYIQTIIDRGEKTKETWYNFDWQEQEFKYFSDEKKSLDKPATLNEMYSISQKLSKDFKYVRVDLYDVYDKIYFGELTFYPYAGFMRCKPKKWDRKLGDMLNLQ